MVFKVIGDDHPPGHYLGYVKYYPAASGDRRLNGRPYRHNTVVAKSFGILAERPEYFVYSDAIGCVITGVPRAEVAVHYSCRSALAALLADPGAIAQTAVGRDLIAITEYLARDGTLRYFGLTGSFLVGCSTPQSDIDLVCYGPEGYAAAKRLFDTPTTIRRYAGEDLTGLYLRRARYMQGSDYTAVITREQRKLQGLTATAGAHVNCEPLRSDTARRPHSASAKEIGEMSLLATVTDHTEGVATPALYGIRAEHVIASTIDDAARIMRRVTYMRSYLGAYSGAFRAGDTVYLSGRLVHLDHGAGNAFGIELTPWTSSTSYLARLTGEADHQACRVPQSEGPAQE